MADALLPCPFCGAGPVLVDRETGPFIFGAYVKCDGCGASQEIVSTAKEARTAWNTRAALAAQQAPAAPAGWQLVPVEPTPEMVEAITECINLMDYRKGSRAGWKSALAAAPTHTGDAPETMTRG